MAVRAFTSLNFLFALILTSMPVRAQIVSTVAGGGMGNGGPATAAAVAPAGIAVDAAGNLYIADPYNSVVRKVDTQGIIRPVAGNGTWGVFFSTYNGPATAPLSNPYSVSSNATGNVYIANTGNAPNNAGIFILRVNAAGNMTPVAGTGRFGINPPSQSDGGSANITALSIPTSVASDAAGNFYFADAYWRVIRKVNTNSVITTVAGGGTNGPGDGGPATGAQLGSAIEVIVDASGNLYITDADNSVIRKVGGNGIISTVAGTGTSGYSGDGGPATNAKISPSGKAAVDGAGNLYIPDAGNNRIRKVDINGTITTLAGNGQSGHSGDGALAINAELESISGVAVDTAGNLYVAAFGGNFVVSSVNRIRKISTNGIITTVAGNGTLGYFGDNGPATSAQLAVTQAIAVDLARNIYVFDHDNSRIRKVDASGIITTVAGNGTSGYSGDGGPATSAKISHADLSGFNGLAVDSAGNLFIADGLNSVIRKVNVSGVITTVAGNASMSGYSGDGGPATEAKLNGPNGLAVDVNGNLYLADGENGVIRKIDSNGIITTVAGGQSHGCSGDGGLATNAQLGFPKGVAVDTTGHFYFSDPSCYVVRMVDPNGIITTVAGNGSYGNSGDGGPATSAALGSVAGLAIDASGNLYIANSSSRVVRKVSRNGIITKVAGDSTLINQGVGYSGDGGLATNAGFNAPVGLAVDAVGNLYITDSLNNRIRVVRDAILKDGFE